jgi:hypothetical protein
MVSVTCRSPLVPAFRNTVSGTTCSISLGIWGIRVRTPTFLEMKALNAKSFTSVQTLRTVSYLLLLTTKHSLSPTPNPRELVDHIRSGPVVLNKLRFRRRTRSNPCDFNELKHAVQRDDSRAKCKSHQELGITEDEWILLIKILGIKSISLI